MNATFSEGYHFLQKAIQDINIFKLICFLIRKG
jgi:hypothetical protein